MSSRKICIKANGIFALISRDVCSLRKIIPVYVIKLQSRVKQLKYSISLIRIKWKYNKILTVTISRMWS